MVDVRVRDWCEVEAVGLGAGVPNPVCESRGCDAAFCGDCWCVDSHMGKHEDWGDCERDREGNAVRDWTHAGEVRRG